MDPTAPTIITFEAIRSGEFEVSPDLIAYYRSYETIPPTVGWSQVAFAELTEVGKLLDGGPVKMPMPYPKLGQVYMVWGDYSEQQIKALIRARLADFLGEWYFPDRHTSI